MSNKIVPVIYRSVIDEVVAAIKSEFAEYGVGEEVLADLQAKWEQKVLQSGVAEFEPPPPVALPPVPAHTQAYLAQITGMHPTQYAYGAAAAMPVQAAGGSNVKSEPVDARFALFQGLQGLPSYAIPTLPGPQIPTRGQPILHYPAGAGRGGPVPRYAMPAPPQVPGQAVPPKAPAPRIPQVDGPSSSSSEEEPAQYAPRTSHPSLPQPAAAPVHDSEAINSDLDDSDDEGAEGDDGPVAKDLIFCTYDKVSRVRNKWKCTFKDGMIHINGKDYLFAKCTGEFEW